MIQHWNLCKVKVVRFFGVGLAVCLYGWGSWVYIPRSLYFHVLKSFFQVHKHICSDICLYIYKPNSHP